jgi:hypothetical protein
VVDSPDFLENVESKDYQAPVLEYDYDGDDGGQ